MYGLVKDVILTQYEKYDKSHVDVVRVSIRCGKYYFKNRYDLRVKSSDIKCKNRKIFLMNLKDFKLPTNRC